MDKKLVPFLLVFLFAFVAFYFMINSKSKKEDDTNSNTNTNINSSNEIIENIGNIELYKTDFKYDESINGYKYTPVELSLETKNLLKEKLNNFKISKANTVVYGKYKLVIDNKTIFFDPNDDFGLYSNGNYEIYFADEIKKLMIKEEQLCSCCINSNCNINLCTCNN